MKGTHMSDALETPKFIVLHTWTDEDGIEHNVDRVMYMKLSEVNAMLRRIVTDHMPAYTPPEIEPCVCGASSCGLCHPAVANAEVTP